MSDCESMSAEVRGRLRSIPAVHELLAEWPGMKAAGDAGDTMVREAIDAELDAERAAIRSGAPARDKREARLAIEQRTHRLSLPTLRPAVNATGRCDSHQSGPRSARSRGGAGGDRCRPRLQHA